MPHELTAYVSVQCRFRAAFLISNTQIASCQQDAAHTTATTTGALGHVQSAHRHLNSSSTQTSCKPIFCSIPAPARGLSIHSTECTLPATTNVSHPNHHRSSPLSLPHISPSRPPPMRSFQTPPLPSDFVPSEQYHDCKVVYGYDLPKAVRTTTYTQKIGIAGCPIETVPLLAIVRHSWSSYWLRYLCHGHEIFPVFTKHISQAMLATELFSRLNHNKIDFDTVALAHCQGAIPPIPNPTKKQALAALADEFYEYMSGLIHEPSSQHTAATDQQSNQRILQLEQQLAATQAQLACSQQQSRYTCHSH